jgi:hypothetical protein
MLFVCVRERHLETASFAVPVQLKILVGYVGKVLFQAGA